MTYSNSVEASIGGPIEGLNLGVKETETLTASFNASYQRVGTHTQTREYTYNLKVPPHSGFKME